MNPLRTLASLWRLPLLRFRLRRAVGRHPAGAPLRIVVGAHRVFQPGWIPTERESLDLLDPSGWRRYFAEGTLDAVLAEHVWEHLAREQGVEAARTCHTFLKPGGHLRIAVPDGLHPDPEYRARVRPGGTGPAAKDHKLLYDYRSLSRVLTEAGFQVRLLEYFDETGRFHASAWDPAGGMIHRSSRFDRRNRERALAYTSLILDAVRPAS